MYNCHFVNFKEEYFIILGARPSFASQNASGTNNDQEVNAASPYAPSKIILTGEKKKTLHKEELTMSETERVLKMRTEHHAAIMQKRRSGEGAKKAAEKDAKVPKQQVFNGALNFMPHHPCAPPPIL